jgi:acetyl esterase/lipase
MEIKIWPNGAPDSNGLSGKEIIGECVENISDATMNVYFPDKKEIPGTTVLLLSGGGYGVLCIEAEGKAMVNWLVANGITAVVLKYRLPNGHHQIPANDARRAIRIIRYNAKEWNIDKNKIGVWGFSAGGHLASTVATVFDIGKPEDKDIVEHESSVPNFTILFYPVITMKDNITQIDTKKNLLGSNFNNRILVQQYSNENNITPNTPPAFLLHCTDDKVVDVKNSLDYYKALVKKNVDAEMLIYEKGGHGPDAFNKNPSWQFVLKDWLKQNNWLVQ